MGLKESEEQWSVRLNLVKAVGRRSVRGHNDSE